MNRTFPALACLLLAASTQADSRPEQQISSQLNGLHLTYYTERTGARTNLYITSFEKAAVICDAKMQTDKMDTQQSQETTLQPEQTIKFAFMHRPYIEKIQIYLVCEKLPGEQTGGTSAQAPATQTSTSTNAPVIVEELPY